MKSFKKLLEDSEFDIWYLNEEIADKVKPTKAVDLEIFTLDKEVEVKDLESEAAKLGYTLASPYELALYLIKNPELVDKYDIATQWDDGYSVSFDRYDGRRRVDVSWRGGRWGRSCRFGGRRNVSSSSATKPSLDVSYNHAQTWECPRCRRIHHILKLTCDCSPPMQSQSTM